jgi:hypothetical protein
MRAKTLLTALLLSPPHFCYAEDTQPDADFLEFIAGFENVDGELLDPMEINDMIDTRTPRDTILQESDNE